MGSFAIVVIGASLGGVEALQKLASGLPRDIPAAFLVAQHIGGHTSRLPEMLARSGSLPARHARHGDALQAGLMHIAPPDRHLIVTNGAAWLTRGPHENWARPAIDPLFRSAADIYGRCVIGVVLTGALNDGTAGLHAVRAHGGIGVVQDPAEAFCSDMPRNALRNAGADFCVRLAEMPGLLTRLASDVVARLETPDDARRRATR